MTGQAKADITGTTVLGPNGPCVDPEAEDSFGRLFWHVSTSGVCRRIDMCFCVHAGCFSLSALITTVSLQAPVHTQLNCKRAHRPGFDQNIFIGSIPVHTVHVLYIGPKLMIKLTVLVFSTVIFTVLLHFVSRLTSYSSCFGISSFIQSYVQGDVQLNQTFQLLCYTWVTAEERHCVVAWFTAATGLYVLLLDRLTCTALSLDICLLLDGSVTVSYGRLCKEISI